MGVSPHYRHKWQVGARSWVTYYFDRAGNRQQVTDIANPTINFVINNLNQCNSASGCIIRNRSGHEVSSFQRLYDAQPVNYHYLNDEHPVSVDVGGRYRYFFYDPLGHCGAPRQSEATTTRIRQRLWCATIAGNLVPEQSVLDKIAVLD